MTLIHRARVAPLLALLGVASCRTGPASQHDPAPAVAATAPSAAERPYVVLVSFDGMRHDFLDRTPTPSFRRVAERGVRAEGLIPVFPSKTFPNHYAIVTGMYGDRNGIVGNTIYDPERRRWYRLGDTTAVRDSSWYGGEPIWVTAERQGVRTGVWYWPGSEAAIGGVRPSMFQPYDHEMPDTTRVDGIVSWLRLPEGTRPHFVALYFSHVDYAAHTYGPDSPQVDTAVHVMDRMLGRLLDSLAALPFANRVNVVLVSDHGLSAVTPERVIALDTIAGVRLDGVVVGDRGPALSLWFEGDTARMDAVHAALARGLSHARVYRRGEIPERLHVKDNPRIGDLLVIADPGWIVGARRPTRPPSPGQHGWDPAVPEMRGIFLAAGPSIADAGTIPAFENVHIYSLLARILGIQPNAGIDGRAEVLRRVLRGGRAGPREVYRGATVPMPGAGSDGLSFRAASSAPHSLAPTAGLAR